MAKADVLTLVSNFGVNAVDANETTVLYDEVVRELGLKEVLIGTESIDVKAGTPVYATLDDNMELLEMYGNGGRIDKASIAALQALFGSDWRNRKGTPLAYTEQEVDDGKFRLVPQPTAPDTLTLIRDEAPVDVPLWLEVPVALEVLSREYSRESDHQDIAFAKLAHQLAALLFNFVGVF